MRRVACGGTQRITPRVGHPASSSKTIDFCGYLTSGSTDRHKNKTFNQSLTVDAFFAGHIGFFLDTKRLI